MNNYKINWLDFERFADNIVKDILADGKKFDAIIGVARGGLFLAGFLAYKLNIREVDTVMVKSYDFKKRLDERFVDFPKKIQGSHVLVVDDILDSGHTIAELKKWLNSYAINYDFAVLVDKNCSLEKANYVGMTLDSDQWVEYPWD